MERGNTCAITLSRTSYDGLVFDLDGVVTRTAKLHAAAWKEMFDFYLEKRAGGGVFDPFTIEDDYRKYVDGKPRYLGVKSFLDARGIDIPYGTPGDPPGMETVCGLGNRKDQLFHRRMKSHGVEVYESSLELVANLRNRGYRVAVASSSRNCTDVLVAAGIADLFDAQVDGIDIESLDLKGKPDPDMFLEAARRLGVEPARCVVLEDAISGVQAGRAGGFGLVIGVNRQDQEEALLEGGADLVVEDLEEIAVEVSIQELGNALDSFAEIGERIGERRVAVFLDYDGTLTPIVSRPEYAVLPESMRSTLMELSTHCTVALVSGRGLADVKALVGIEDIYYAGSHGFEMAGPDGFERENEEAVRFLDDLDRAQAYLEEELAAVPGSQVERKRFTIAIHYRNVGEELVGEVDAAVKRAHRRFPGFRRTEGKKVFELQPDIDWNKGRAIEWLMEAVDIAGPGFVPLYIGDDITDEDAFEALKARGITVVVGDGERCTGAQYRLESPEEVGLFIVRLTALLEEESTWWLVHEEYDPGEEGLREALYTLGNGYFATRGAAPESRADGVHYPGTYLAGGYNRLKTEMAGRVIENEDLVNIPNWLCFDLRIEGGEWFDLSQVEILSYRQELHMKTGVLHRSVQWRDAAGRETRMHSRRMVSMADMHKAAIQVEIVPLNWSGTLEVRSALDGKVINSGVERYGNLSSRHLEPVETRQIGEDAILLKVRTNQSRIDVAQAARTGAFSDGEPLTAQRSLVEEPGYIAQHILLDVSRGSRITLEKTVVLYTSRDNAISECALAAEEELAAAERFQGLLQSHAVAWNHMWRRFEVNLRLFSLPEQQYVQRILRLYRFHLLQTACMHSMDIDVGMPSRGWHGEAYRGHIFWDELIIFPFLNYRTPQITRTLLMYRYRRLGEARKAARKLGYKGAMFPWQSGSDGREETQQVHLNPVSGNWLPDNSHLQRHINAAIVYNIWQYYQVTGDLEFLAWYGAEMILEITRFWASLAEYDPGLGRYEIKGVMGPDEYHDAYPDDQSPGLNNNSYTNVMVVFVMNRALDLLDIMTPEYLHELCDKLQIGDAEIERWREISRKMRVVFHADGIISQFEGYDQLQEFDWEGHRRRYGNIQRLDRILEAEGDTTNRYKASKQADVLMLFYLFSSEELGSLFEQLGYDFDPEMIPRNIDYYLSRTSNGSSLSWIIHSWVAARRDRGHSWELFNVALLTDFADVQVGTTPEGIHLGAMAGCVDMVGRGYTGMECRGDVLRFNPAFPEEMEGLTMLIRYRGRWLDLDISSTWFKVRALSGGAGTVKIDIGGETIELREGETLEVAL
jgi:alpha,alpha-trehalase